MAEINLGDQLYLLPKLKMAESEPSTFRPLHNLYAAVLNRALNDIGISVENSSEPLAPIEPVWRRRAFKWINEREARFLSFDSVCEILKLNPTFMRRWIIQELNGLDSRDRPRFR